MGPLAADAQRPAPAVEGYAEKPSTGAWQVYDTGILTWDYWGIMIPHCDRVADGLTCILPVSNGSDDEHELCLGAPTLEAADGMGRTRMEFVHTSDQEASAHVPHLGRDTACVSIGPHKETKLTVTARSHSFVPSSLRLILTEQQTKESGGAVLSAPAQMPIILSGRTS